MDETKEENREVGKDDTSLPIKRRVLRSRIIEVDGNSNDIPNNHDLNSSKIIENESVADSLVNDSTPVKRSLRKRTPSMSSLHSYSNENEATADHSTPTKRTLKKRTPSLSSLHSNSSELDVVTVKNAKKTTLKTNKECNSKVDGCEDNVSVNNDHLSPASQCGSESSPSNTEVRVLRNRKSIAVQLQRIDESPVKDNEDVAKDKDCNLKVVDEDMSIKNRLLTNDCIESTNKEEIIKEQSDKNKDISEDNEIDKQANDKDENSVDENIPEIKPSNEIRDASSVSDIIPNNVEKDNIVEDKEKVSDDVTESISSKDIIVNKTDEIIHNDHLEKLEKQIQTDASHSKDSENNDKTDMSLKNAEKQSPEEKCDEGAKDSEKDNSSGDISTEEFDSPFKNITTRKPVSHLNNINDDDDDEKIDVVTVPAPEADTLNGDNNKDIVSEDNEDNASVANSVSDVDDPSHIKLVISDDNCGKDEAVLVINEEASVVTNNDNNLVKKKSVLPAKDPYVLLEKLDKSEIKEITYLEFTNSGEVSVVYKNKEVDGKMTIEKEVTKSSEIVDNNEEVDVINKGTQKEVSEFEVDAIESNDIPIVENSEISKNHDLLLNVSSEEKDLSSLNIKEVDKSVGEIFTANVDSNEICNATTGSDNSNLLSKSVQESSFLSCSPKKSLEVNPNVINESSSLLKIGNVLNLLGVDKEDIKRTQNIDSISDEDDDETSNVKDNSTNTKIIDSDPLLFGISENVFKDIIKETVEGALSGLKNEIQSLKNQLTNITVILNKKGKKRKYEETVVQGINADTETGMNNEDSILSSSTCTSSIDELWLKVSPQKVNTVTSPSKASPMKTKNKKDLINELMEGVADNLLVPKKKKKLKIDSQNDDTQNSKAISLSYKQSSSNTAVPVNYLKFNNENSVVNNKKKKKKLKMLAKSSGFTNEEHSDVKKINNKISSILSQDGSCNLMFSSLVNKEIGDPVPQKKKKKKISLNNDCDTELMSNKISNFMEIPDVSDKIMNEMTDVNLEKKKKKKKNKLNLLSDDTNVNVMTDIILVEDDLSQNVVNKEKKKKKKLKKLSITETLSESKINSSNLAIESDSKKIKKKKKEKLNNSSNDSDYVLTPFLSSCTIKTTKNNSQKLHSSFDGNLDETCSKSSSKQLKKKKFNKHQNQMMSMPTASGFENKDVSRKEYMYENTSYGNVDGENVLNKMKSWKSSNKNQSFRATPFKNKKIKFDY